MKEQNAKPIKPGKRALLDERRCRQPQRIYRNDPFWKYTDDSP